MDQKESKWSAGSHPTNNIRKFSTELKLIFIYVFLCRAPNPETVLVIQTPSAVFSAKNFPLNKKRTGSRLISSKKIEIIEDTTVGADQVDPLSAARCRIYRRLENKVL